METIEIEKCTVCKSSVIDDIEKGEKIMDFIRYNMIRVQKEKELKDQKEQRRWFYSLIPCLLITIPHE